jgi:hypothetical protein
MREADDDGLQDQQSSHITSRLEVYGTSLVD